MFHLNRLGYGKDDISSEEHFENSKTSRVSYLDLSSYFCPKIRFLSQDPVPLKVQIFYKALMKQGQNKSK
jgi:hypothetical protein